MAQSTAINSNWPNFSTGFDAPGADHFKNKLRSSRKWIGTTEIYVALTFMRIRVKIVDFPKVKATGVHELLVKWIINYFSPPPVPSRSSSASLISPTTKKRSHSLETSDADEEEGNALTQLMNSKGTAIRLTNKQPLYLQHQGHSRTVIGVEVGKGGDFLLIADPGK